MVRVMVYDDSKPRRDSLEALVSLTPELEWVGGFENCDNVVNQVSRLRPDLVLMDIQMPGTDGIEGVRLIKLHFPDVKVMMQTSFDDDDKVFRAIQLGAEGYILKTANVSQIAQSIDEVMKGGAVMTPSIALKVMRFFSGKNSEQVNTYNLSPKELEVLKMLSDGLSYKMVADRMGISYFTVNNHVKKIYQKLQVHSLAEAVALLHRDNIS